MGQYGRFFPFGDFKILAMVSRKVLEEISPPSDAGKIQGERLHIIDGFSLDAMVQNDLDLCRSVSFYRVRMFEMTILILRNGGQSNISSR